MYGVRKVATTLILLRVDKDCSVEAGGGQETLPEQYTASTALRLHFVPLSARCLLDNPLVPK